MMKKWKLQTLDFLNLRHFKVKRLRLTKLKGCLKFFTVVTAGVFVPFYQNYAALGVFPKLQVQIEPNLKNHQKLNTHLSKKRIDLRQFAPKISLKSPQIAENHPQNVDRTPCSIFMTKGSVELEQLGHLREIHQSPQVDYSKFLPSNLNKDDEAEKAAQKIALKTIDQLIRSQSTFSAYEQTLREGMSVDSNVSVKTPDGISHNIGAKVDVLTSLAEIKYEGSIQAQLRYHIGSNTQTIKISQALSQNSEIFLNLQNGPSESKNTINLSWKF